MRKKYILCYHHLMIFIFLFILMTKKNTIILIAIVCIIIVVWLFTSNTNVKKEPTAYDICHWTWYWFEVQVTACGDIIKQAQYYYHQMKYGEYIILWWWILLNRCNCTPLYLTPPHYENKTTRMNITGYATYW